MIEYNNMMNLILFTLAILICVSESLSNNESIDGSTAPSLVEKNGMKVHWEHRSDSVHFDVSAPTTGWLAIGFNPSDRLKNTYLIMGCHTGGSPRLVEHYAVKPGDYRPIVEFGGQPQATRINGTEKGGKTRLRFSLPLKAADHYRKDLHPGRQYFMLMAYSRSDDFQHHSIMRTSVQITL